MRIAALEDGLERTAPSFERNPLLTVIRVTVIHACSPRAAFNMVEYMANVLAGDTGGRHECRRRSPQVVTAEIDVQHAGDRSGSLLRPGSRGRGFESRHADHFFRVGSHQGHTKTRISVYICEPW